LIYFDILRSDIICKEASRTAAGSMVDIWLAHQRLRYFFK